MSEQPTDMHLPTIGQIFIIRHGRTAGNNQRYVGWEDLPLDALGIAQAHAIAARLAEEQIDKVYASSLERAQATARPLAEQQRLPVYTRDELREINYGEYQGMLKSEHNLTIRKDHLQLPMPGGECLFDVYERVGRLIAELRADVAAVRHVAVIGHFWSNRMLVGALHQLPFEAMIPQLGYKPENGSIYAIRYRATPNNAIQIASTHWIALRAEDVLL